MSEAISAAPRALDEIVYRSLLPHWLNNFAENLPQIRSEKALDLNNLPEKPSPCVVIAAGPSVKKNNHLGVIRDSGWKHTILCCDKILADCLKHDIKPYATATIDASELIHGFYTQGIVRKNAPDINGVFPTYVHPKVAETWLSYHGRTYWFTPIIDDINTPNKKSTNPHSVTVAMHLMSKGKAMISGVGNVGGTLWNIAYALKADPIILVGFDFSEQVTDKAEAIWFEQMTTMFVQSGMDPAAAQDLAAQAHQPERNPDVISDCDDRPYYIKGEPVGYLVNPYWKHYRDLLAKHIVESKRHTINATGGGCLHSEAKDEQGNYILKVPNFETLPLAEALARYNV